MTAPIDRILALLCVAGLSACVQAPDLSTVQAERAKPIQRTDNFQAVAGNGRVVIAAAGGGALLSSTDSGLGWVRQVLAAPSSVIALAACPDGRFAGLDFYRKVWTADADGKQWQSHPLDDKINALALTCDPANRLWVVGSYSTILTSADHGASWTKRDLGKDSILTTVQFVDAQHGFITGEFGTVLRTTDAGATWQQQPVIPNDFYPYSAIFIDQRQGWLSGLAGAILHTDDGGQTWVAQGNPGGSPMFALLSAGEALFAVGAGGRLLMRHDRDWLPVPSLPALPTTLTAGIAIDAGSLLVAGAGGTLQLVHLPAPTAAAAALSSSTLLPAAGALSP